MRKVRSPGGTEFGFGAYGGGAEGIPGAVQDAAPREGLLQEEVRANSVAAEEGERA